MIIATGNVNIDENKAAAENASNDAKNAANSAADEANKVKSTIDGKITTSSQAPFDDGVDHSNGDVWYVQDTDHNTTAMYTYDGSTWDQTKMTTSTMSVGQLSALTADLGTIDSGYINSVTLDSATINAGTIEGTTITGAYIEEQGANGTITLSPSGFNATSSNGSSYLQFQNNNNDGYTVIRGGLDFDSMTSHSGNISVDGRVNTATQSMTSGSVFACSSGALYFETNPNGGAGNGSGTSSPCDIHAGDIHGGDFYARMIHGHLDYLSGNGNSNSGTMFLTSPISIQKGGEIISATNGAYVTQNKVYGLYGQFDNLEKSSQLSIKNDIQNIDSENALNQILSSDIMQYKYKNQDNTETPSIGPIIDDEHEIGSKQYSVSNLMLNKDNTALSLDNEIGLLMGAVQELSKRNSDLSLRIASLERKNLNG